ncbi:riboflavin kinase [Candidatus Pacebacteria bacterium]|nr:riboflavin kinase [Candidatus Paceibacterota bacterium]
MQFSGQVIKGDGYGRIVGYPTVNIDRDDYLAQKLDLKHGIYAGFVTLETSQKNYLSGIVIGPFDTGGLPKLEAHLIDFSGDLYGEMVTFYIFKHIRPFKVYETKEALRVDIEKDITAIKEMNLCLPE